MADPLLIARHDSVECTLLPALANRHGLITGATGTGNAGDGQKLVPAVKMIVNSPLAANV